MNNLRWLLAFAATALVVACDSGRDRSPAPPYDWTASASGPACDTAPSADHPHALVGYVFDAYSGVVGDSRVDLFVETARSGRGCSVRADQGGQFRVYLPDSKVSVHVDKPGFVQPCAVTAEVLTAGTLDVELMAKATLQSFDAPHPRSSSGLSLNGMIFETTGGVRSPIAGAEIWIQHYDDIPVATTLSDLGGRYFGCNLPAGVGVYASKPGYTTAFAAVDPSQSPTLDVELRPEIAAPVSGTTLAGAVYRIESDSVFHVANTRVVRPPQVVVPETISEGSYVRVTGTLAAGVLTATEIDVLGTGRSYQLDGQVEMIHTGRRLLSVLGIELFVNDWTRGSLERLAVGDWVSVRAYRNHFAAQLSSPWARTSMVEGAWFAEALPPVGFTLQSVTDFTVQATPRTVFRLLSGPGDGDCYGGELLTSDEFWGRASESRPERYVSVYALGRYEGALIVADEVWLCYPYP
jgi:hypothetical protein